MGAGAHADLGQVCANCIAMARSYPMDWGSIDNGSKIDILCRTVVFDVDHDRHVMELVHNRNRFHLTGLLEAGNESYTIFDATMVSQYPVPHVTLSPASCIIGHKEVTWDSLFSVVDMCSGFGGFSQGCLPCGFHATVAVDHSKSMLDLYNSASNIPTILGDVGSKKVIKEKSEVSQGAKVMTAGFSCQPFSTLGDGRSSEDPRSSCLSKILYSAFYLRMQALILECVAPACQDPFVRTELEHFCKMTGFHCSQRTMKLDSVWPAKRTRSWWILTSPGVGHVSIPEFACSNPVATIEQIIPVITQWDLDDEIALALNENEKAAFGGVDMNFSQHLINSKGVAPCALHAWGNQLTACPCGCRAYGLSSRRLAEKGLFGLLVFSAADCNGVVRIRHVHPCEAMALNGFDPLIDFGRNPRLILCAIGQLASPFQVLWVMSALGTHFDEIRFGKSGFTADMQLHAYMSWMIMGCNLIWPPVERPLIDEKLSTLVQCWQQVQSLSLSELMFPPRWEARIDFPVTLAAILDLLFREKQTTQVPTLALTDGETSEPETPWLDFPSISDDPDATVGIVAEFCTVIFDGDMQAPVRLSPLAGTTLQDLLKAHERLLGSKFVCQSFDVKGEPLPLSHVLEVGQVIFVRSMSTGQPSPVPVCGVDKGEPAPKATLIDPVVSPTSTWSQLPEDPAFLKPSVYDIGECTTAPADPPPEWLCAEPLLGLQGDQFLMLSAPMVGNPQQLWSIRHQFLKVQDRLAVLERQGNICSDDEIRFHLYMLTEMFMESQVKLSKDPVKRLVTIDPILTTAWMYDKGFPCEEWGKDHGHIFRSALPIATVFLVGNHWVPVSMHPNGNMLNVFVWDADCGDHIKLNSIIERIGLSLGFLSVVIQRDRRMFFTSELCGTLAIVYLHCTFLQAQLPTSHEETMLRQQIYRDQFVKSFAKCDITKRPWIWGKGDTEFNSTETIFQETPVPSMLSREQRTELIVEHRSAVADDEIRFHIQHIVERYDQINTERNAPNPRKFIWFEPLVYTCWESIGRTISARWCERHSDVKDEGVHIVTAFLLEDHWFPFWIEPNNDCITFHTLANDAIDAHRFRDVCACIGLQLGFSLFALHIFPNNLPPHDKCGTQAMMFLAHVIHGARLPDTIQELNTLHANMRAVFVEDLYAKTVVPAPVIWGNGIAHGESGPLPIMPCVCPFEAPICALPGSVDDHVVVQKQVDWPVVQRLFAWCSGAEIPVVASSGQSLAKAEPLDIPTNVPFDALELAYHVSCIQSNAKTPSPAVSIAQVLPSLSDLCHFVQHFNGSQTRAFAHVVLVDFHWVPIVGLKSMTTIRIFAPAEVVHQVKQAVVIWPHLEVVQVGSCSSHNLCGAMSLDVIQYLLCGIQLSSDLTELGNRHQRWRHVFATEGFCCPPSGVFGFGPHGALTKELAAELVKHGVPAEYAEKRALDAIQAIGSEQLGNALKHKQTWKQLKALGNNHKFKFVLPAELAQIVEEHKNAAHGGKGRGKQGPKPPTQLELDPGKLQTLTGIFRSQDKVISQIHPKQIGPVSSGVALMTMADAEPYLRSAKQVSSEPLALIVLHRPDTSVQTQLPHCRVTVPCRCTVDNEPVLVDATLVQIGTGVVEKFQGSNLIHLDTLEVVTLKYLVYKDEIPIQWDEFCKAPIRFLVGTFPLLRRCYAEGCTCELWHNPDDLAIKEPLLDVWRRQYLRTGFKPSPADKADMFSVCLRVPMQLWTQLLSVSGAAGAYCEPRTADGTEVMAQYTVIWTPKQTDQELRHMKQTNPAIIGLARVGDRKGVRVLSCQASAIHSLVRPDTVYLPQGQKTLFLVGPFPFGSDRAAICKAMKQVGWDCRPLQPSSPCPGRGSMWLVQAVDEPSETIVSTTHGEVVVTKYRAEPAGKTPVSKPVASASTLALCGARPVKPTVETDPWSMKDPWSGFKPSTLPAPMDTTESMQQMEVRVQNAVLAKLPPTPMEDDIPERMSQLEDQVQHLLAKQNGLEVQFQDYTVQQGQQLSSMQTQLNTQGQQLHGHMENQNQAIQSMFAQQMEQIRGLLSKRPREENE